MELINRNTDYAVRAIVYMATSGKDVISTAELNKELDLPRAFMRKIFQSLEKEGYLVSIKGNQGGFSLNKPLNKIFLIDLIKIFQGDITMTECLFRKKICPNIKVCPVREKIKNIEKMVKNELEGITIAGLLK